MGPELLDGTSCLRVMNDSNPGPNDSDAPEGLFARLVRQALPPNLSTPAERAAATAAAENAIRHMTVLAGFGAVLLIGLACFRGYSVSTSTSSIAGVQATRITSLEAETATQREKVRMLQRQLEEALQRQTVLQGEAAAYLSQIEAVKNRGVEPRSMAIQPRRVPKPIRPVKLQKRSPADTPVEADLRPAL